jgi:hypothetical protein
VTTGQAVSPGLAQREPALVYGGGLTGASLVVDTVVGLGIPLTDTTRIIIILVVSVVGPMIGTWLTRMKVSPKIIADLERDAKTMVTDVEKTS